MSKVKKLFTVTCRAGVWLLYLFFWLSLFYLLVAFAMAAIKDPRAGVGMTVFLGTYLLLLRGLYLLGLGLWDASRERRGRLRNFVVSWSMMNEHTSLMLLFMTHDEKDALVAGLKVIERQRKYKLVVTNEH